MADALSSDPSGTAAGPSGSNIQIERFPDGVTINVPALGIWKGSKGLFVFAILWNGIVGVISLCMLAGFIGAAQAAQAKQADTAALWIMPLVLSLFWVVGIGLLLATINMGKRRAALAVTGGSLMVIQTGLFGSKKRTWEPGEVEQVCTGPSGLTVNDVPVPELQIHDGGGKLGLLCDRADAELEWMAAELRQALQLK